MEREGRGKGEGREREKVGKGRGRGRGGMHTFIRKGEEGRKEKGEPGNRVIDFATLSTEPSISRLQ